MTGHRHPRPDGRLFAAIAFGQQHGLALILLCQYPPPGVDNGRVPPGFPRPRMRSTLGGREHITLGFDGSRTNQHIPVCSTGHGSKGRGCGNQLGTGGSQFAVQLRKSQVITDCQADSPDRCVRNHHATAISIVIGFAITAAIVRHVHVEQVQLVVARHRLALIIDQQRAGMHLGRRLIHRRQRQGTGHYP
ncbi:hypothetical protein D3C76_1183470 [compost metagenome]